MLLGKNGQNFKNPIAGTIKQTNHCFWAGNLGRLLLLYFVLTQMIYPNNHQIEKHV